MIRTARLGALICSLALSLGFFQERGWRGIVPLHSTRKDGERLVAPPMTPGGITYDLETERLNLVYSAGSCREVGAQWNVPRDSVIGITVYPQTRLVLADLKIDLKGFEKFINPYVGDRVTYSNKEEGIAISTTSNGELISIEYFPAAKDNHLRCPTVPQGIDARKFDEYSNLPFSDEKARLDNFAIYLQKNEPTFTGYIIVYAGQRARSGTAQVRAKRARDYLVKVRGIEATRIVTIDGGCRSKVEVELYALPTSTSPPTANPNCNK